MLFSWILLDLLVIITLSFSKAIAAKGSCLEIRKNEVNPGYLIYSGKPVIAFGHSPQNILTFLPRGDGNNVLDWIQWARGFGINNVRSYPPSIKVDEPAVNIFEKSKENTDKFDLNVFNDKYFDELRKACLLLKKHDIIVHLQF